MDKNLIVKKFCLALANLMITAWNFTGGFAINCLSILIYCVLNFKTACKNIIEDCENIIEDMDFCKTDSEVNIWGLIIGTLSMPRAVALDSIIIAIIACKNMLKYYQQVVNFDEQPHPSLDDEEANPQIKYHSLIETIKSNFCESNLITTNWANTITKDINSIAVV